MYCNRQKARDGFIPDEIVSLLFPIRAANKLASKLVDVGLWERCDGGYRIHDYHDYQPTAEQAAEISEKRAAAGRAGGIKSGATRQAQVEANAKQVASTVSNPVPVPVPVLKNSSAPGDAEPSPDACDTDEPDESPEPERGKGRPDELPPDPGTRAHAILLVIRGDPQLSPIVSHPCELSRRLADLDAFPGVNHVAEAKRAGAWLASNPKQRKKNGARFLLSWFGRAQEKSRPASGNGGRHAPGIAATGQRYATGNLMDMVRR